MILSLGSVDPDQTAPEKLYCETTLFEFYDNYSVQFFHIYIRDYTYISTIHAKRKTAYAHNKDAGQHYALLRGCKSLLV